MRVCIIFYNLGGYHLARLDATNRYCVSKGWDFNAIEITRTTSEHPWGVLDNPDYVTTLIQHQDGRTPSLENQQLLDSALDELNPDAVAIPGWGHDFSRRALKWCQRKAKRAILMSESKYDDAPRFWLKELAKKWLYVRRFDSAVVGGKRHREYLEMLGMSPQNIFPGYDVVDNDFFISNVDAVSGKKCTSEDGLPNAPFFLASNRFIDRKNIKFLIRAFSEYRRQTKSSVFDLVLLGNGELMDDLKSFVSELGLENQVHFPGFIAYKDICSWYAAASVFVHPATSEQWGLVVNEAMAAGLPTLVSQTCGCMPDLMREGETGYSFDPTRLEDLVAKMLIVANNQGLRKAMGTAARVLIQQQYSADSFAEGVAAAVSLAMQSAPKDN